MKQSAAETSRVTEEAALTAAACLFDSLSKPSRLAIVQHLALGEHRVVDLTKHLGLPQATVSAALRLSPWTAVSRRCVPSAGLRCTP